MDLKKRIGEIHVKDVKRKGGKEEEKESKKGELETSLFALLAVLSQRNALLSEILSSKRNSAIFASSFLRCNFLSAKQILLLLPPFPSSLASSISPCSPCILSQTLPLLFPSPSSFAFLPPLSASHLHGALRKPDPCPASPPLLFRPEQELLSTPFGGNTARRVVFRPHSVGRVALWLGTRWPGCASCLTSANQSEGRVCEVVFCCVCCLEAKSRLA